MQSQSSPFVQFARDQKTPKEVARLLGCDERTAREGLRDARETLRRRQENADGAVQILLHSALARPSVSGRNGDREVSRWRAWLEVVLGIKKAA